VQSVRIETNGLTVGQFGSRQGASLKINELARLDAPSKRIHLNEGCVSTNVQLNDYPTTPLYNIKAVVQATGISPSTLRAWERRYQICHPHRTESGYRLYSDRDIAMIRWLKAQVDAGMAISQAVSWLDTLAQDAAGMENVALPVTNGTVFEPLSSPGARRLTVRDSNVLYLELLNALLRFDEISAEQVLTEAFALYPVEFVGEQIITPVLVEIGERWHRGEVSITVEHYATTYLLQRLAVVLRSVQSPNKGALIWVACAPSERHEIGALLLVIYLRRAGYQVRYIGADVPIEDFISEVHRERPALILLSASLPETAPQLQQITAQLSKLDNYRPIIGYGGRIFRERPELRNLITGVYMGDTALEAVESTNELLLNRKGSQSAQMASH
jgi:methanogenic corrinoid protein MtbC1